MEIQDVLADEVIQLGGRILAPEFIEAARRQLAAVGVLATAQILEARHVADRRVQPDIEIFAGRAGNLEAEVGRVARDVPVAQAGVEPLVHLVGGLGLQVSGAGPDLEKGFARPQLEEVVLGVLAHRCGAGHGGHGIDQVGRAVGGAAGLAGIAVLILGVALRAFALDEAVRQEHLLDRIVELLDGARLDQALVLEFVVDVAGQLAIFVRVRGVIVVEGDMKTLEVALVLGVHALDQLFRRDAFLLGAQHDRRAVGIVGADVIALVAAHLLEAHPDVGLDVFHQVPKMDRPIGIGQGTGDEQGARGLGHGVGA